MSFAGKWMELEVTMLMMSQFHKDKHDLSFLSFVKSAGGGHESKRGTIRNVEGRWGGVGEEGSERVIKG
jgi:hypothetical protein